MRLLPILVAVLACSCAQTADELPYYNTSELTPEWVESGHEQQRGLHRIADFALTDQTGRSITAADMSGKVYVASFFFTSCRELCPRLKTNLTRVQATFANDARVMILSHTVLPEADSTAALARYAETNDVRADKWLLLRGSREELWRLATQSYFVELDDDTGNTRGNLMHTEALILVDGNAHIRGVYDGSLQYEISRLIDDLSVLLRS